MPKGAPQVSVEAMVRSRFDQIERDTRHSRQRLNPLFARLGYLPAGEPLYVEFTAEQAAVLPPIENGVLRDRARRRLAKTCGSLGLHGTQ